MELGVCTGDVFEISGRGTILIVEPTGLTAINVGDKVRIGSIQTIIKGVEMISSRPLKKTSFVGLGLLVEGGKSEYQNLKSEKVYLGHKP